MSPSLDCQPNPFSTRFIRPGALPFSFESMAPDDIAGKSSADADDPNLASARVSAIVDRLDRIKFGLIVGPHGTGKSTLLQTLCGDLACRYPSIEKIQLHAPEGRRYHHRLRHGYENGCRVRRLLTTVPVGSLLIIDGIEQLLPWDRWWLRRFASRNGLRLLATSHTSLVGFSTLYVTAASRPLVECLSQCLLCEVDDQVASAVRGKLDRTEIHHDTDIRSLWFDLYDVVEAYGGGRRVALAIRSEPPQAIRTPAMRSETRQAIRNQA
tara:strand:- start:22723 stop:23526 length:804 start_codon:yes stop_codon:yes gene_type:complete